MCKICEPILGTKCVPHTEETCALRQAAYCPVCGPGTHFPRFCPKKPRRVPRAAAPIATVETPPPEKPIFLMSNSSDGYMEYLKQNCLEVSRKAQENRYTIEKHLASRETPMKLVTPIVPEKQVDCSSTECGIQHAGNEACAVKKRIIRLKK